MNEIITTDLAFAEERRYFYGIDCIDIRNCRDGLEMVNKISWSYLRLHGASLGNWCECEVLSYLGFRAHPW